MERGEGLWILIFKRTVLWLVFGSLLNAVAFMTTGSGAPWILLPIAALVVTLSMMAVT